MAAFESAVRLGFRYLETDVHVTADGVLVAFHDARLDRVTDRGGAIAELTWAEVRRARIDGRGEIPTFEDLLGAWPHVRVNVDPKADAAVEPLVEAINRTGAAERVCVGAFSDRRIGRVSAGVGAALCTGMGPRSVARLRAASLGAPVGTIHGHCAQVPSHTGPVPLVTRRFVDTAHRLGKAVHVWTIDDPDEMHRLLDLGVDGIMTDRPAVLRSVLESRNAWS